MVINVEKLNIKVNTEDSIQQKDVNGNYIYFFSCPNIVFGVNSKGTLVCISFSKEMIVQHKGKTSERSPLCRNCGTWIKHWKKFAGNIPAECCINPCAKERTLGYLLGQRGKGVPDRAAHVIHILGETDETEFLVPVCESDNPANTSKICVAAGTWFVWANQCICE